ncbi:1-deoxy-D-xylulose-5-phosphate synthase [Corynebacterium sp. S7]
MSVLSKINSPADLKALPKADVELLADEIRQFLVEKVSATGGHLGPNLGVVEMTIALHQQFDSPDEPIIWDTSHQAYVHKILTGRADQFDTLRQKDGLSGYTDRAESEHDWTESSHASAALSYADGLAKAFQLQGKGDQNVVAVVGDGALTGGMCWEALNNIAAGERNVVIVVNDNGRSYSPTIGGFSNNLEGLRAQLANLRYQPAYDEVMEHGKKTLKSMGWVGERTFDALHAIKEGVKYQVLPTSMFPELGMKYIGPIEGHDLTALNQAFEYAKKYDGPLIVHVVTEKGHGYAPAFNDEKDQMHTIGVMDPETGVQKKSNKPDWTSVFSQEVVAAGEKRDDIVAITAAMSGPVGLQPFAEKFPSRFYDVGIAEQHAVTSAAGLALGGMHPVVALYSTFLNRAFDQLLMDVGLLKLPVTFVLDRSGVTGPDGASHNGVWDLTLVSIVPGVRIAAPRDATRLAEEFNEAIEVTTGPTVVRFPKGDVTADIEAIERLASGTDVLYRPETPAREDTLEVLFVAVGTFAEVAIETARTLHDEGILITVVDPRWVYPIAPELVELAAGVDMVVTMEDGLLRGGVGSAFAEALSSAQVDTPVRQLGFPSIYPRPATRPQILEEVGLDQASVTEQVREWANFLAR